MNHKNQQIFFILAGANGVGKTTLSKELLKSFNSKVFLNADEIAKSINSKDILSVRITAGKKLLKKLNNYISKKETIVIESTLSGNFLLNFIDNAKHNGYKVVIIYTFADNPEICIARIKNRVKNGGHFVPDEDVKRRFYRSVYNFWYKYKNAADLWFLYYNMKQSIEVAKGIGNDTEVIMENEFNNFVLGAKKYGKKRL